MHLHPNLFLSLFIEGSVEVSSMTLMHQCTVCAFCFFPSDDWHSWAIRENQKAIYCIKSFSEQKVNECCKKQVSVDFYNDLIGSIFSPTLIQLLHSKRRNLITKAVNYLNCIFFLIAIPLVFFSLYCLTLSVSHCSDEDWCAGPN